MTDAGKIYLAPRYTRERIKAHPDKLYVFGDNMAECGFGGQAKEARGEANSVGIPTKWAPSRETKAYFTDDDVLNRKVLSRIAAAFVRLENHLVGGGDIVWPSDGVGTGLSQLPERAPRVMHLIMHEFEHLKTLAKEVIDYGVKV